MNDSWSGALQAHEHGDLQRAFTLCGELLDAEPSHFGALQLMGVMALQVQQPEQALVFFEQALQVFDGDANTWTNLGSALHRLGDFEGALGSHDKAVQLDPQSAQAWYNRGITAKALEHFDVSLDCYREAITLMPGFQAAHYNLANLLHDLGRYEEALEYFDRAVELDPQDGEARKNRAFARLMLGLYKEGWEDYEWRWTVPPLQQQQRDRACPQWTGTHPLSGKSILVHAEQGLGDTLQFCRYVQRVKALGAAVIFEVQKPLVQLLKGLRGADAVVPAGLPWPPFDFHVPLLSLPRIFRTRVQTIEAPIPYLQACPDRVRSWEGQLEVSRFNIGICWQGSTHGIGVGRAIPLAAFEGLAGIPEVELFSLQKGIGSEQLRHLPRGMRVRSFGESFDTDHPFLDTAAVMTLLDLVITTDTAVAHLAGGLGVPVWVALPYVPDWRWQHRGHTTPWYPQMKLFRQTSRGDWASAFEAMEAELRSQPMPSRRMVRTSQMSM